MLIRGSKKFSEVICSGQNLFLFWQACNVLPRLFLITDCLQSDFCLKICLVRMPASEIKTKENPSSSYCAFGFSARPFRAWILTRGETLKEMYNDINHSRPTKSERRNRHLQNPQVKRSSGLYWTRYSHSQTLKLTKNFVDIHTDSISAALSRRGGVRAHFPNSGW